MLSSQQIQALAYVFEQRLRKPFSDNDPSRGYYLVPPGKAQLYPTEGLPPDIPGAIYRPKYGLAHAARLASNVKQAITLGSYLNLSTDDIAKLEIVAVFYAAGNEGEAAYSTDFNSDYQRYARQSAEIFSCYASQLKSDSGESVFTADEIQFYVDVLSTPFSESDARLINRASNNTDKKKAVAKKILAICNLSDSPRHQEKDYLKKMALTGLNSPFNSVDTLHKTHKLRRLSERQLILTGNFYHYSFNEDNKQMSVNAKMARRALFQVASTDPVRCARLISVANLIELTENKVVENSPVRSLPSATKRAVSLAIALNQCALRSDNEFNSLLKNIEDQIQLIQHIDDSSGAVEERRRIIKLIDEIIAQNTVNTIDTGRLLKSVNIMSKSGSPWNDAAESLINPEKHRPELRTKTKRKAATTRLSEDATRYEGIPTSKQDSARKPRLAQDIKKQFTRSQSTTFANYAAGYTPPVYGIIDLTKPSIGISISVALKESSIPQRIMGYDPTGTYSRYYDADTVALAQSDADERIKSGMYHLSYENLQAKEIVENKSRLNEVMARLRWARDQTSHVTIFNDIPESRLLAQLAAADLEYRLKKRFPTEVITVPISIYPDFAFYDKTAQENDFCLAAIDPLLQNYTIAIEFFKNRDAFKFESYCFSALCDTLVLLLKINPTIATEFQNNLYDKKIKLLCNEFQKLSKDRKSNAFLSHVSDKKYTELTKVTGNVSRRDASLLLEAELLVALTQRAGSLGGRKFQECFESFNEFFTFFSLCDMKHHKMLIAILNEMQFINTFSQFIKIYHLLDSELTPYYISVWRTKISALINNVEEFKALTKLCWERLREEPLVLNCLKEKLIEFSKASADNFIQILICINSFSTSMGRDFLVAIKAQADAGRFLLTPSYALSLINSTLTVSHKDALVTMLSPHFENVITDLPTFVLISQKLANKTLEGLIKTKGESLADFFPSATAEDLIAARKIIFECDIEYNFATLLDALLPYFFKKMTSFETVLAVLIDATTNENSCPYPLENKSFQIEIAKKMGELVMSPHEFIAGGLALELGLPHIRTSFFTAVMPRLSDIILNGNDETNWDDFVKYLEDKQIGATFKIAQSAPNCAQKLTVALLKRVFVNEIDKYLNTYASKNPGIHDPRNIDLQKAAFASSIKILLSACETVNEIKVLFQNQKMVNEDLISKHNNSARFFRRTSDDTGKLLNKLSTYIDSNVTVTISQHPDLNT